MSKLKRIGKGIGTFLLALGIGIIAISVFLITLGTVVEGTISPVVFDYSLLGFVVGIIVGAIGAGLRSASS